MNVSTVFSAPLTPPAESLAIVQAGKAERNAFNSLSTAANAVIPSISDESQYASQGGGAGWGAAGLGVSIPAPQPAPMNFSQHNEVAPTIKG